MHIFATRLCWGRFRFSKEPHAEGFPRQNYTRSECSPQLGTREARVVQYFLVGALCSLTQYPCPGIRCATAELAV